ncbi:MAG TPA: hypothetical protein VK550_07440 [Polyangiaceae bacterium]|nr:hypothetical protein [Polyangiaceae bacterium]
MADRFKGNHVESYIHASDHVAMWSKGRSVPETTHKCAVAVLTKALMKDGERMQPPEMDALCSEQLKIYVEELFAWYDEQSLGRRSKGASI